MNAADWPEGIRGSISRYLGLVATTTGDWPAAEGQFEDAITLNAMGMRPWLAQTQDDYARMLLARGGSRDSARADEFRDVALATYLGIHAYMSSAATNSTRQ